jgi:vitamin B12 transporter
LSPIPWGHRRPSALARALLVVVSAAGPAPARADGEERASGPRVEEIEVRAPRSEAARDRTAAATVIRAERFAGEAKDVAALLATAPGVAVQEYGGLGQLATVSVRGSMSSGVLVLLDGIPLENASGAGVDLASIPRHWIERVEVVRGAEGAHYGAGALAGVVNVITRRPRTGGWEAEAGAGSFGTGAASAAASGAAGDWTFLASASADGSEGRFGYLFDPQPSVPGSPLTSAVRAHNAALRGGLLLKAGGPAAGGRLDLLGELSAGHRELAGWPYHLTPSDWQDDERAQIGRAHV